MPAPIVTSFQPTRKTFGSGQLFINNISVGEGNNGVFTYTEEAVYQESGKPLMRSSKSILRQAASLEFQTLELSTRLIRQALNAYQGSTGAIMVEPEGVSVVLTGVVPASLGRTNIVTLAGVAATETDITVQSIAGVTYAATEYVLDEVAGTIRRVTLLNGDPKDSDIPDGATVVVQFAFNNATAEVTNFGGAGACETLILSPLRFVYKFQEPPCDQLEIVFHKASPDGGLTVNFEKEAYSQRDIRFESIADLSKPQGYRLGYIAIDPVS